MLRVSGDNGDKDKIILDTYTPADGIYIIVKKDGSIICESIKQDKKTGLLEHIPSCFEQICFYDYHSRLVSMDKPIDPKKVIHSNGYLSFWIKQESIKNGKLNIEAIDRYFDILSDPRKKYTKPKDREMYDYIAEKCGAVNQEKLKKNQQWIKKHIFSLEELNVTLDGKNYLKIFFEDTDELYISEEQRYLVTKIFNKNDYNLQTEEEILGLPNDNLGLNSKKPYAENKSRKVLVPHLVTSGEAVLQRKFFDFLMNKATVRQNNIFFDMEDGRILCMKQGEMVNKDFCGLFLQVKKGKEVEILHQDVIVDYRCHIKKFTYQNVLRCIDKEEIYKQYGTKEQMQALINDVLFSKWLVPNYFKPAEDLQVDGAIKRNMIYAREPIFAWLYKGCEQNIDKVLEKVALDITLDSIRKGHIPKARKQFNLMCSFREYFGGGEQMADVYAEIEEKLRKKINSKEVCCLESDDEYYYAVGQLVNYFISLNQSKVKTHSLANPFFCAKDDQVIKEKIRQFFVKYNYKLKHGGRKVNNLCAMISRYAPDSKVNQSALLSGYLSDQLIYEKTYKEEEKEYE